MLTEEQRKRSRLGSGNTREETLLAQVHFLQSLHLLSGAALTCALEVSELGPELHVRNALEHELLIALKLAHYLLLQYSPSRPPSGLSPSYSRGFSSCSAAHSR